MYKHIAINLWMLFIVVYESYGFDNGNYMLDKAIICYSKQQIPKQTAPKVHKSDENYWVMYKADDDSIKNVYFQVSQILTMIKTVVYIETGVENQRIILDFELLDIAQKMCLHYANQVDLDVRQEYDLLKVLDANTNQHTTIMPKGKLWFDPFNPDDFGRFTIVQSDNHLPHFIFHTKDFNVSQIINKSEMFLTININGDEDYKYLIEFAKSNEAESFRELVTTQNYVETGIEV